MLNILIMGAGAIGCFVGGTLAAAGHQVRLVGRQPLMQKIAGEGLCLSRPNQLAQTVFPDTATSIEPPETPYDFILLTVKAPATKGAAQQISTLGLETGPTYIVSLQNGIGNEETLANIFSPTQVIAGTVTIPIQVPETGKIAVSKARGGLGLAPLVSGQPVKKLAEALNQAGLSTATYAGYRAMKWSKLLLNIVNNASGAILDQTPAEIVGNPDLFNLEIRALHEGVTVMKANGINAIKLPGYPSDWLARLVAARWLPMGAKRALLRPSMLSGRGTKMPSLHIDLASGRATSEIDVLNGAIVKAGQQAGVSTPVNLALTTIMTGLIAGNLAWDDYRGQPETLLNFIQ